MVKIKEVFLVTRNARDKIQTARYVLNQEGNNYIIQRYTGQFGGKITTQPEKVIEKGKAKRTVLQQAELEFNSLVKKATDKGYKELSSLTKTKIGDLSQTELDLLVPTLKTDANGNIKPQQAKSSKDCTPNVFNTTLYCSRKLDGVRCLMRYNKESDTIHTVSRGGGDYDPSTEHIRSDEVLLKMFRENPDIILDGELYFHGEYLQRISGIARLKTWEDRCAKLEYWVYDIADVENDFEDRFNTLEDLGIHYFKNHPLVKIQEHKILEGWSSIKRQHDAWIEEGFEGLVARKPNKKYAPGRRNSDWIKVKEYQDDEFEITGISEGLRDEDFCFTLKTKKGQTFKAKPMGSRELREEYLENWPLYVGKMGTVQFFELSKDGVPIGNTTFKHVREKDE